jgi:hypothetical protein
MPDPDTPRGFKGVWINAELWKHPDLNWTEKCLVAEIDSLTTDDRPCYASNARLADVMQISQSQLNAILSRLQLLDIVKKIAFRGTYTERAVSPEFSSNPETSRKWIESSLAENRRSTENRKASITENRSPIENQKPALRKTVRQPYGKPQGEILERVPMREEREKEVSPSAFSLSTESEPKPEPKAPPNEPKPDSLEKMTEFSLKNRMTAADANYCWCKWESNGWRIGGSPIKSWKHAMIAWRDQGYLPSTKQTRKP